MRWFGHNGGTPGYMAQMDVYPGTGHVVVIMANMDNALGGVMKRSEEIVSDIHAPAQSAS